MKRRSIIWRVGIVISATACSEKVLNIEPPASVEAISRVVGVVTDANGTPLDSARVFVAIPNSPQTGYASAQALTNNAGRYAIDVKRMLQLGIAPTPDTVRVEISAQRLKGQAANSSASTVKTNQLLTFSSAVQTPPTQQVDIKFSDMPQ